MGTTPIFGYPYPDDTTPNDLHAFFLNLAAGVETEMSRQGPLEDRPPAGVQGRLYWATTSGTAIHACFYRDDGTAWRPISKSGWRTWNPTISGQSGSAYTVTVSSVDHNEYRIDGDMCFISYAAQWTLSGGPNPDAGHAVQLTIPVSAHNQQGTLIADVEDGNGRCLIGTTQDFIAVLPANNAWVVDNAPRWVRIDGWYRMFVSPYA